ncbi:hypothetical protein GYA25_02020 [Candidatus Woesearchaeota archaeon]|nr:hypothetical protein [Candidatus Woesearchaeota archaeon]
MTLEYLVSNELKEKIEKIDQKYNFFDYYNEYSKIFSNIINVNLSEMEKADSLNMGILLISHDKKIFYNGGLWQSEDVEYIGKLDCFYTAPAWDWWINPLFERKNHKKKNKTLMIVNNFDTANFKIKKELLNEKFKIEEEYNLSENNSKVNLFYKYLTYILPLTFSRELKRMNNFINRIDAETVNFVLRGGFFLREFFDIPNKKIEFLNPKNKSLKINNNHLYVDDCIGSGKTLSLFSASKENINYCCLNSTLPCKIYEEYFPNVTFSLPNQLLNFYSCRLFEDNPYLIGVDYNKKGQLVYYNNPIRDKLIKKIKSFNNKRNITKEINKFVKEIKFYNV